MAHCVGVGVAPGPGQGRSGLGMWEGGSQPWYLLRRRFLSKILSQVILSKAKDFCPRPMTSVEHVRQSVVTVRQIGERLRQIGVHVRQIGVRVRQIQLATSTELPWLVQF